MSRAHPSARSPRPLSRRVFLQRLGRYGGAAVLGAMLALDLVARDRGGFRLAGRAPSGRGRQVVVLGAGIAGLVTAYELMKLGYDVVVLEARRRPGGRVWTVRRGDTETEVGGETQTCQFPDGNYFHAGAMRLSHHHASVVDYCREFRLPLIPFPNYNEAAFVHRAGQPRLRIRELAYDLRGHTSELLAKAAKRDALDLPLTAEDREKLVAYLRAEGGLDRELNFRRAGDTAGFAFYRDHPRGYAVSPGAAAEFGAASAPLELATLLRGGFGASRPQNHELHQQETMLAISGGMDRLPRAFAERLGERIRYGAEVREVRRTAAGGARVVFLDANSGTTQEIAADFCACTLPPHLLARLATDFAPATLAALRLVQPDSAGKIGLQFKRRFWEEDDDIFGGRSVTDQSITQLYYPHEGFGTPGPAVLIGAYHFSQWRRQWDVPHAEREKRALAEGGQIHPQYPAEFDASFSVEWHRIRHSEMAWPWWRDTAAFEETQRVLKAGDGPFYFAGDWMSALTGWTAGAALAAHELLRALHQRANS